MELHLKRVYVERKFSKHENSNTGQQPEAQSVALDLGSLESLGEIVAGPLSMLQDGVLNDTMAEINVPGLDAPILAIPAVYGRLDEVQAALVAMNPISGQTLDNANELHGMVALCRNSEHLHSQVLLSVKAGARALIIYHTGDNWPHVPRDNFPRDISIPCVFIQEVHGVLLYRMVQFYKGQGPVTVRVNVRKDDDGISRDLVVEQDTSYDPDSNKGLDLGTTRGIYDLTAKNGVLHKAVDAVIVLQGVFEAMGQQLPYFSSSYYHDRMAILTKRCWHSLQVRLSGSAEVERVFSFEDFVKLLLLKPWVRLMPGKMKSMLIAYIRNTSNAQKAVFSLFDDVIATSGIGMSDLLQRTGLTSVPPEKSGLMGIPLENRVYIHAPSLSRPIVGTVAEFGTPLDCFGVEAPLILMEPLDGASEIKNKSLFKDCIVVCLERVGGASEAIQFEANAFAVQRAGAVGLIVVRSAPSWPHYISARGWLAQNVHIKCAMVASSRFAVLTSLGEKGAMVKLRRRHVEVNDLREILKSHSVKSHQDLIPVLRSVWTLLKPQGSVPFMCYHKRLVACLKRQVRLAGAPMNFDQLVQLLLKRPWSLSVPPSLYTDLKVSAT